MNEAQIGPPSPLFFGGIGGMEMLTFWRIDLRGCGLQKIRLSGMRWDKWEIGWDIPGWDGMSGNFRRLR